MPKAGLDVLSDALTYAVEQLGDVNAPVAVLNATGAEDDAHVKISSNACYNLENTINGVFNTVLIRATRQTDETLGLIALAAAHRAENGRIIIAQENAHGATAMERQIQKIWPDARTIIKYKCRILVMDGQGTGDTALLTRWTERAAIQKVKHNRGEFWTAPGVFSWDRPDLGSRLLLSHLPNGMPGIMADLGCGNGLLSMTLAKKEGITELYAIDADSRAVECCRLNLEERACSVPFHTLWRDATKPQDDLPPMDYVITNPPFHTQQDENRELGQQFCVAALRMLKSGGHLYLVANRHLPYEAILENEAAKVTLLADTEGFKIIRATAK